MREESGDKDGGKKARATRRRDKANGEGGEEASAQRQVEKVPMEGRLVVTTSHRKARLTWIVC